jgi:hypothetical protein
MTEETHLPPDEEAPPQVEPSTEVRDDGFDFDLDAELPPPPPRRRRFPLVTAGLALCAAVGGGVVLGILIQKHWGSDGSGGGRGAALAAALASGTGQTPAQTGGTRGQTPGAAALTRNGTIGQVKAIDGTSLYVTDLQGNTVKVTTGPGVRVRVTSDATLKKISPGDYVTVQGTKTATGYKATSITDSGQESPFSGFGGGGAVFGSPLGGGSDSSSGDSNRNQQSGGDSSTQNVPTLPGLGG